MLHAGKTKMDGGACKGVASLSLSTFVRNLMMSKRDDRMKAKDENHGVAHSEARPCHQSPTSY